MTTVKRIELDDLVIGDLLTVTLHDGRRVSGELIGLGVPEATRAITLRTEELPQEPRTTVILTGGISHIDRHED